VTEIPATLIERANDFLVAVDECHLVAATDE